MIGEFLGMIFGGGRNVVRETVEVFRPNAEAIERMVAPVLERLRSLGVLSDRAKL